MSSTSEQPEQQPWSGSAVGRFPAADFLPGRECFVFDQPSLVDGIEIPALLRRPASDLIDVDTFTGAAHSEIPLYLPRGRSGFGPNLRLGYDSRNGNGVFGMGWSIQTPFIATSHRRCTPDYLDPTNVDYEISQQQHDRTDCFVTEELVPVVHVNGDRRNEKFDVGEYSVIRYRLRFERTAGLDRIERWIHQPSGQVHWRTVDADNVTSLYGINDQSRVSDPSESKRIARWLLNERFDDKGNVVRFVYKSEDMVGVDLDMPSERHRRDNSDSRGGARYLKRVLYGNAAPHDRGPWHYEVVLDYGEHDLEAPSTSESSPWQTRPDAFSTNRAGFEQRIWRRCRRVLTFHRFKEFDGAAVPVSETAFIYDDSHPRAVLTSATHTGFVFHQDSVEQRSLPTLAFAYTGGKLDLVEHVLESDDIAGALADHDASPRWVDFYGEGLSGLMYRSGAAGSSGKSWRYIRNLGGGRFAPPEEVPYEDGVPDLDLTDAELAHERSYQPLISTGRSGADQHVGYLDLNGDDATDVIVANDEIIRWYPSQGDEGFADPIVLEIRDRDRPQRLSFDDKQSFHVADMNGDGMLDLVRVGESEVSYWPNLGRGRFGERIVVASPPQLHNSAPDAVLFANLTGRGTADIVCVGKSKITYWENHGGRRFGPTRSVVAPGMSDAEHVGAVDLFGRGHDCIVWLDGKTVRYLAIGTDRAPELLVEASNGRGVVCRAAYVCTADLWRRDRDAGVAWLFTVPVSVEVVERVETREVFTGTRSMCRYLFRHGAWDDDSRSFVGFAASETWSGGLSEDYALPGLFDDADVPDVPEYRRNPFSVDRRWFHTGLLSDGSDPTEELLEEFHTDEVSGRHRWLAGHRMPTGMGPREASVAYKALRGCLLRHEFGPGAGGGPLTVQENTAEVVRVQASNAQLLQGPSWQGADTASFRVLPDESVSVEYDPKGIDPRVGHQLVLAADEFGHVTLSADIVYRRRTAEHPAQELDSITVEERSFVHKVDQTTWYRVGIETRAARWQLGQMDRVATQLLTKRDLIKKASRKRGKVLVSRSRRRFWSNDVSRLLDVDEIESRALFAHVERFAFDDKSAAKLATDDDIDDLLIYEGGYRHDDAGWWAPGLSTMYDPSRFYVPRSVTSALGHETKLRFDVACLDVEERQDAYGNSSRHMLHPRAIDWWRRIDVNQNEIARRFDALGNVLSVAVLGDDCDHLDPRLIEATGDDNPTAVVTYELTGGTSDGVASWVRVRHREVHANPETALFEEMFSFDAFARLSSVATRNDQGRWRIRQLVERDCRGNVVRIAQPFFSTSPFGRDAQGETALANGTRISRNLLGIVSRIDHPDGTVELFNESPWSVTHHDSIDNVLDSAWYASRQGSSQGRAGDFGSRASTRVVFEGRAGVQAAAHAQTPTVRQCDARKRIVSEYRALTRTSGVETTYDYDAMGNLTKQIKEGRVMRDVQYDMLSRVVCDSTLDGGARSFVLSAPGLPLRRRNPDDSVTRLRYDACGRPTHVFVSVGTGEEHLVERIVWGGGETSVAEAVDRNLVGTVHLRVHAGGVEVVEKRNSRLQPERISLYSTIAQSPEMDWSCIDDVRHAGEIVEILAGAERRSIDATALVHKGTHDALGRTVAVQPPGGGVLEYRFGALGYVDSVWESGAELIGSVRYDATGAPTSMQLGNAIREKLKYDAFGRPEEIVVVRRGVGGSDDTVVQDQHIVYDPNGNVVSVTDRGELVASFTYDGLDRLVKAEGFEPGGEGHGLRRYSNNYTLDEHDNLVELHHSATGVEWRRTYGYEAESNKLRATSRPAKGEVSAKSEVPMSASYDYDAAGNSTKGINSETFVWNHEGNLVGANNNGTSVVLAYDSSAMVSRRLAIGSDDTVEESIEWAQHRHLKRTTAGKVVLHRRTTVVAIAGRPVAVVEHGDDGRTEVRYQVADHLGSVVAELSRDGGAVTEEEFAAFGAPWLRRGRDEGDLATKQFAFRGGRFDTDLTLLRLDDRWYSPWLGRYIDHVADGSSNPYALRGANPQSVTRGASRPIPDAPA